MDALETFPKSQGPGGRKKQMLETHLAIEIRGGLHLETLQEMRGTGTVRIGTGQETQEATEMIEGAERRRVMIETMLEILGSGPNLAEMILGMCD